MSLHSMTFRDLLISLKFDNLISVAHFDHISWFPNLQSVEEFQQKIFDP